MAALAYERLGFLDNSFLIAESPTNHMHIAGTATYEAGPLRTPEGGIDVDRIRDYVASRRYSSKSRSTGIPHGWTTSTSTSTTTSATRACRARAATTS